MSGRRARRQRAHTPQAAPAFRAWTIPRATTAGLLCGFAAIMVATFTYTMPDGSLYPYAVLLAVTAFCGASILWITVFDMRERGTSGRMRPIRAFDAAIGAALLVPSLYALSLIWDALGF
jgi:hypothetical protein